MSDVEELPVSSEVEETVEEAPVASEAEEAPVASEAEEAPVASEADDAPVASEAEEAPVASEAEEAPVASEADEAPVASEADEAPVASEVDETVEEAPIESEPETVDIEQVASDIREILTTPTVVSESSEPVSYELSDISLATLIRVLGQWSAGDIRKRSVESELLSGTETDENLDTVEKMVEILKLWIQEKGSGFKSHDNYFKNIDEYTLVGESKNWTDEKKQDVVLQVVKLTIDVSNRRISRENIHSIVNSL